MCGGFALEHGGFWGSSLGDGGAQGGLSIPDRREPIILRIVPKSSLGVRSFRVGLNE